MILTFRPIDQWNQPVTKHRTTTPFSAPYSDTLTLLDRELRALGATRAVLMADVTERDCRLDGQLRADARPSSPRVQIVFESRHGTLRYACDRFTHWHANLRAIALGLEALRKVDRYGIGARGEQYTGYRQLPPGTIALGAPLSRQEAWETLVDLGTGLGYPTSSDDITDAMVADLYRMASKLHHPDTGGDAATFSRATAARDVLLGA